MKNKKTYIILAILVMVGVMIWNVVNEPGIKDLQGDFKEVAFIRNEQNTGPVIRVYAVIVQGEPWKEMEQYGNYMPHTKYGTTKIYFFQADRPYPSTLALGDNNIPEEMKENCLAIYEKDGMSQVKLQRYPFRN
ncbi:hypothetical protein [Daejeonella sp.]|uniref:hypothetical protein n=1 Tax=Daejeonella sp. TaxID=2805397 RepID=UPI0030BF0193